ncbi:MAG: ligase-associated DNA damage response endonuclease PdeM [Bacteroidota bacterium]
MKTRAIQIEHQNFQLHPRGAVYWEAQQILLIADVHFGKVMHFRKHGSAVPMEAIYENFKNLNQVLDYFRPKRVIFLGDLFHSYQNMEWDLFREWIKERQEAYMLIVGNHDVIAAEQYEALGVNVEEEYTLDSFFLTHHPETKEGVFNIAGHLHPGVRFYGMGKQKISVSCFYQNENGLILPAFGAFTGKHLMVPKSGDQIFAVVGDEVIPVQLSP